MSIDEINEKAEALSMLLHSDPEKVKHNKIKDYVISNLDIKEDKNNEFEVYKNFVYLMCQIYKDIKEIEARLDFYKKQYNKISNDKSNEAEYKRKKLNYFIKMNRDALSDINLFIANDISSYLDKQNYDLLEREYKKDELSDLFKKFRYDYAIYHDYYSEDFPFSIFVKIYQYVRTKCKFENEKEEENLLLNKYAENKVEFWKMMFNYVDDEKVMQKNLETVTSDYNLHKRQEIFETMSVLFEQKKYQTFIVLGLIQIEGLFDDYCTICSEDYNNHVTLKEKVEKALEQNESIYPKMYPYFAFDIPLLRNEVAHKGFLKTENAKKIAYEIVLDLNTLLCLIKSESISKFIEIISINKELLINSNDKDEIDDKLLVELLGYDQMLSDCFFEVIKNPEKYRDEIEFYNKRELSYGETDFFRIICNVSNLFKSEGFWKAMHRLTVKSKDINSICKKRQVGSFIKKIKDQYIGILEGAAKTECIEVSKIVNKMN